MEASTTNPSRNSSSSNTSRNNSSHTSGSVERVRKMARENALVVFSLSSCPICHVAKRLFCNMGVSPLVVELDELADGTNIRNALVQMSVEEQPTLPVVFVGGHMVSGIDRLMATQISGALKLHLERAGAIWL